MEKNGLKTKDNECENLDNEITPNCSNKQSINKDSFVNV